MSKKGFKAQASSSRVVPTGFGSSSAFGSSGFGGGFGAAPASKLSYVYEPPDLSLINDSSIQVSLKNLQKKDSTTKAKALEDLQAHVTHLQSRDVAVEESILEAWVVIYPRTSIDNSRRVRQLAHTFQGQIAAACGKRIAKHLPSIVGAWLCGLQDSDKTVAKGVRESFEKVFPSVEKQKAVWEKFSASILEYCRDAILKETAQTLSDERVTSPDDAEAKYARVTGTSLLTVAQSLISNSQDSAQQEASHYEEILGAKQVWKLASYQDSFVRRALFGLLAVSLSKLPKSIDYNVVSSYVVQEALHANQSGSSDAYIKTLLELTRVQPAVWTDLYSGTGKKSPPKRLSSLLHKGSQGATTEFWPNLSALLHDIPIAALISDDADSKPEHYIATLVALKEGVSRKEELRTTQSEAWKAYLQLAARILSYENASNEIRVSICKEHILPILTQFIRPVPDAKSWNVIGNGQEVCALAIMVSLRAIPDTVNETLSEISTLIIQDIQISLPEQSKDFESSQEGAISQGSRWYSLLARLQGKSDELDDELKLLVREEIRSASAILKHRNGKPYSAAAIIDLAVRTIPKITIEDNVTCEELTNFATKTIPHLMTSPSSPYLLRILESLKSVEGIGNIYQKCLQSLVDAPKGSGRNKALGTILSSPWPKDSEAASALAGIVEEYIAESFTGNEDSWTLVIQTLRNKSAPTSLVEDIVFKLTDSLTTDSTAQRGLDGLELLAQNHLTTIRTYITSQRGTPLLSRLLFLSQSDEISDDVRAKASKLKNTADRIAASGSSSGVITDSMADILRDGTFDTSSTSLSVESLIEQAMRIIDTNSQLLERLLPPSEELFTVLSAYFDQGIHSSLALTNSMGGAIYIVDSDRRTHSQDLKFDRDGLSPAVRVAMYLTALYSSNTWRSVEGNRRAEILQFLAVYKEYAADNLLVHHTYPLWSLPNGNVDMEVINRVKQQQSAIATLLKSDDIDLVKSKLLSAAEDESVLAYYNARAYASLVEGSEDRMESEDRLSEMRRSQNVLVDVAFLCGIETSRASLKLCNELFSDLAGKPLEDDPESILPKFVLLNRLIDAYEGQLEDIPQQRIMFFVKHAVKSLKNGIENNHIVSEVLKILCILLPAIRELYGEFWEEVILFLITTLGKSDDVPTIYYCLRLSVVLQLLAKESANDDVEESWNAIKTAYGAAMVKVLEKSCNALDVTSEPRNMINRLLGRQFLGSSATTEEEGLFKPLFSLSTSLQQAAYGALHHTIPLEQQEVSVNAALSDFAAKLPDQLMELIAQRPDTGGHLALRRVSEIPASLNGYLLSWKLIFDHWTNASYQIQSNYVAQIKKSGVLDKLLAVAMEILVYRNGSKSTVNPSKYDLLTYTPNQLSPKDDAYWLLSHVYYLSLVHLPSLVKDWWRSSCPRYLERQMEEWTEKYISTAVVAAELATVSVWDPNPDETELEVRVSARAREVTASYPIDEQHMSIRVVLPPSYPLQPVVVVTGQRVGVDEKKWAAWLNNCSIMINFNSSSQGLGCVVDGLMTWRNNVVGKLKGQSECAICYSVVGGDKQLPTKKCATCKNMFHGSCLFRWFKSSSSSSCPLCRNAFNY